MAQDSLDDRAARAERGRVLVMTSRVFTREDVADQLKCSIATVSRMIRAGQLRAIRIGRRVRIPADSLDALIAGTNQPAHLNPHRLEMSDYSDGVETPSMLSDGRPPISHAVTVTGNANDGGWVGRCTVCSWISRPYKRTADAHRVASSHAREIRPSNE